MNDRRLIPRLACLIGTAALLASAPALAVAQPSGAAATLPTRFVVHSASGGISKGSYQGGVDWTISEFLRRQRNPSFQRALRLQSTFELGAVTGASAGNINALFAALGWCTRAPAGATATEVMAPIPPEGSLFWRAWIETGIGELLPLDERTLSEPAAFSRKYYGVHRTSILDVLNRATPLAGCSVPVGLTMTKLTPIEVAITGGDGSARVQRFSSVFDVVGGATLDFQFPQPPLPSRESLGAMALLPRLKAGSGSRLEDRLADVFDVVLASSAFPVAFASQAICYEAGGLRPKENADATLTAPCPKFIDGGVFDNNPLGLAIRLDELKRKQGGRATDVEVAYTNPDTFRGDLNKARTKPPSQPDRDGLAAMVQLAGGAVASARQYELQSLARQIARDSEPGQGTADRAMLLQSSRGTPIVGETVRSFGAFLGRPFREYDFYVGIYDGLEFVARHFLCAQPQAETVDDCATREHLRLIDDNLFGLTTVGRTVVNAVRNDEHPAARAVPAAASEDDRDALAVLLAIHREFSARKTHPFTTPACETAQDLIEGMLCPGGLDDALDNLSNDAVVTTARRALFERCRVGPGCHVDEAFQDLLNGPRRHMYLLAKKAFENIEHGEDLVKKRNPQDPEYTSLIEWGFSVFRASTLKYRNGIKGSRIEWNLSTGRFDTRHPLPTLAAVILPNYLLWSPFQKGEDPVMLGWRPVTVPLSTSFFLSSAVELSLRQPLPKRFSWKRRDEHVAFGASVGTFSWHPLGASTLEAGVVRMPPSMVESVESQSPWAARLSGRWAADKVMGAVTFNTTSAAVQVGISDLNGIFYWWLR